MVNSVDLQPAIDLVPVTQDFFNARGEGVQRYGARKFPAQPERYRSVRNLEFEEIIGDFFVRMGFL